MNDNASAYPLSWPSGWKRTRPLARKSGKFKSDGRAVTLYVARKRLADQLEKLGASAVVLSTDVELRADGVPRSGKEPADPGVAVYFLVGEQRTALACDRYDSVGANAAALAATIEAKRVAIRHGVVDAVQEFRGYARLETPDADWKRMLGDPRTRDEANENWKRAAKAAHPDAPGGSHDRMAALNRARARALEELPA